MTFSRFFHFVHTSSFGSGKRSNPRKNLKNLMELHHLFIRFILNFNKQLKVCARIDFLKYVLIHTIKYHVVKKKCHQDCHLKLSTMIITIKRIKATLHEIRIKIIRENPDRNQNRSEKSYLKIRIDNQLWGKYSFLFH